MISSQLDYCKLALSGLPTEQLSRLQIVQSSAARLVLNKNKRVVVVVVVVVVVFCLLLICGYSLLMYGVNECNVQDECMFCFE